jgi:protein arginine kinase activator
MAFSDFLNLLGLFFQKSQESQAQTDTSNPCPCCGFTMAHVIKFSKLGCPVCYEHFRSSLLPVFAAAHAGGTAHAGKHPKHKDDTKDGDDLESLQLKLEAAIKTEAYEEAGKIKKKIDLLKSQQLLE